MHASQPKTGQTLDALGACRRGACVHWSLGTSLCGPALVLLQMRLMERQQRPWRCGSAGRARPTHGGLSE